MTRRVVLGFAGPDADREEARKLRPLQAAAIPYRIAFGPRARQKVLTLRGAMPRDDWARQTRCADIDAFCWPAASWAQAARVQALPAGKLKCTWVSEAPDLRTSPEAAVHVKSVWVRYGL